MKMCGIGNMYYSTSIQMLFNQSVLKRCSVRLNQTAIVFFCCSSMNRRKILLFIVRQEPVRLTACQDHIRSCCDTRCCGCVREIQLNQLIIYRKTAYMRLYFKGNLDLLQLQSNFDSFGRCFYRNTVTFQWSDSNCHQAQLFKLQEEQLEVGTVVTSVKNPSLYRILTFRLQ